MGTGKAKYSFQHIKKSGMKLKSFLFQKTVCSDLIDILTTLHLYYRCFVKCKMFTGAY